MSNQTGKLSSGAQLDHPHGCDECGKPRSHGNHTKCSKARQARMLQMSQEGISSAPGSTITTQATPR